jgi:large subunit ribosomal protein L22
MEVQAKAKWVRTSPRKVRLVAQTLRNLPVSEALVACSFMPKSAARDVAKVIRSAQANAENNFNLVKDDLVIKEIRVEAGPMLKRGQPRAMGRLFSIFKRTSHITAVVEDRPGVVRRRAAALPRAPQPTARPAPTPAAAAAARAAAASQPATTESDEVEAPARPRKAKAETVTADAAPAQADVKKADVKKADVKKADARKAETKKGEARKGEVKKTESKKKDEPKKDTKEKKSK